MTGGGGVQYIEDRRKTDAGGGPEPADGKREGYGRGGRVSVLYDCEKEDG